MGFLDGLLSGGVEGLLKGAGSLAKDIRTAITGETTLTSEAKAALDGKLVELDMVLAQLKVKTDELRANIIIAETKSQSWLARNWRPILMLTITAIIANNYVFFPYASLFTEKVTMLTLPDHLWALLKIGVGGYIVGRSAETVTKNLRR
jgi:hypothetical protein